MNKKIIYYVIIIVLFLLIDKFNIISIKYDDYNYIKEENNIIRKDLEYISNLNYDYNYELCKISIKDLYSSNTYFIKCNFDTNNNVVLNNIGFIGLVNKGILTTVDKLILKVKINDNVGILKNNKINIIGDSYNIGDNIYVSYLEEEYLIGYISNIVDYNTYKVIDIKYIDINNSYVAVLV